MLDVRQLLYLNVLMNSALLCGNDFESVGEFAERTLQSADKPKERVILENILADERLRNMAILDARCEKWGAGYGAFADGSEEAVVAFRGTTTGAEWYDNFISANQADGAHQRAARAYLEGLDLSGYERVTVTGHSKGGNKAMYCAAVSDVADRCVSFDGQGFSDAFMMKYADRLRSRQGRIENHCAGGDYINILLNGIGRSYYYETFNSTGNFFLNHELTAMCDDEGRMHPGDQDVELKKLDLFGNSYLRSLSDERRNSALDFLGRAMALILKGDAAVAGADDLLELVRQPKYRRDLAGLLAYIIQYERQTGEVIGALRRIVANSEMDASLRGIADRLLDALAWQADNPLAAWGIATGINALVENRAWSYLLGVISEAALLSGRIKIDPNSGADIRVAYVG